MIRRTGKISFSLLLLTCLVFGPGPQKSDLLAMNAAHRTVLSNQLVLLVSEEPSLPFITFQLLVDAGSWRDPSGKEGLANLSASGLLLGTSTRSDSEINLKLDFMGASLTSSCGRDFATLKLRILKKELDEGFNLFMDVLTQSVFPEQEVRNEMERVMGALESVEDQPGEVAERAFRRALFLDSPYAHPVEGAKESLEQITRQDLLDFYRAYYHPNNSILAIAGDITVEEVKSKFVSRLQQWPQRNIAEVLFKPKFAQGPKTVAIDRPISQANIILGHGGVERNHPDYYTISVMNYILGGGGFGSRLMEEIRTRKGLAYAVYSVFVPQRNPGSFQIMLQTQNTTAREAVSISLQEMGRMQKEPVSEDELETAKRYLIGSFPMRFDTQEKLADFLAQIEYYGLGLDYPEKYPSLIESVTREDILRVASEYLHPQQCILSVVGNLSEAGFKDAGSGER